MTCPQQSSNGQLFSLSCAWNGPDVPDTSEFQSLFGFSRLDVGLEKGDTLQNCRIRLTGYDSQMTAHRAARWRA